MNIRQARKHGTPHVQPDPYCHTGYDSMAAVIPIALRNIDMETEHFRGVTAQSFDENFSRAIRLELLVRGLVVERHGELTLTAIGRTHAVL